MGIWRTHYTSQVYRSLHWVLSGVHFSKVYVLAKMRALAMVLLLGSAEGHEYPDLQVGDEVDPRLFLIPIKIYNIDPL